MKRIILFLAILSCIDPADYNDPSPRYDINPKLCNDVFMSDSIPPLINDDILTVTNADFNEPRELIGEEKDWYNEVLNCFADLGIITETQAGCMSLKKPQIIIAEGRCITRNRPRINCTQFEKPDCRFVLNTGCVRREFVILEQSRFESRHGEALFKHEITHWIHSHLTGQQGHPEPWFFLDGLTENKNDYDSVCGAEQCSGC